MVYYSFLSLDLIDSEEQNSFTGILMPSNCLVEDIKSKYEMEKIEREHCEKNVSRRNRWMRGKMQQSYRRLGQCYEHNSSKRYRIALTSRILQVCYSRAQNKLYTLEGEYFDIKICSFCVIMILLLL